eukprot:TRINITY_DN15631_c0_g1_i1.p1 TRINITY_DN15631_c0_g1~~TRINITY_DN15631_c0_g1_i1.p1  ORF type:complete len:211 (-),score=43.06 TRINITY_DN15631_c0_g1_i1:84-716(-)
MKRINQSTSSDDHSSCIKTNLSNTSQPRTSLKSTHKNPTFWYLLRRFKKTLRDRYSVDMQNNYERGRQDGLNSNEVRNKVRQLYHNGHAQGFFNGLVRLMDPMIKTSPSTLIPEFVTKLLEEFRHDIKEMRTTIITLRYELQKVQKEGIFKVKKPQDKIAIKTILPVNQEKGDKKRSLDLKDEFCEIEIKKKRKKRQVEPDVDKDASKEQ